MLAFSLTYTYSICKNRAAIPEAYPQIRVELRKRLHLDLERVERLPDIDGGRGADGARNEVDGHMLRVLLSRRVLLHDRGGGGYHLLTQFVSHMVLDDERGS